MKNNQILILKKIFFIFLVCILFETSTGVYSQTGLSFRVFPDTISQFEPIITVSPLNPLVMFCSCNSFNTYRSPQNSEGIFVTTNGGLNWFGSDMCNGQNINNHNGDPGIAIDKNGRFLLKHIGYQPYAVLAHYSTDMGSNWSTNVVLSQNQPPEDKGAMITDNNSTSPYYGRTYITGVNYQIPYPVLFSYTTNGGTSWSSYSSIPNSAADRNSGGELAIGRLGQVYDIWAVDSGSPPGTEKYASFGRSTDGGVSWSTTLNVFNMHGIGMLYTNWNIFVNGIPKIVVDLSGGSRDGWLYVVTNEYNLSPAGSDFDIIFHRSTNGGTTWSPGIRVNQDALNNGKVQLFPAICVDSTGTMDIIYYDNRNTTSDSLQVFMSRSSDGGNTWYDQKISDRTFKPVAAYQYHMGDFIDIVAARNKLFPVWMANYTGIFQIWTTIMDIPPFGVQKIGSTVPKNYILVQNYPNPFNPSTTIEFSIPNKDNVKIVIYDALGKEVNTLVNQQLEPGSYKVNFEPGNLASGIYYYSLITNEFSSTKKMVLVK